jgi:hypothetical protein
MAEAGCGEAVVHAGVGAEQGDRGHVPVQPGHVQRERRDCAQPDGADDLSQDRRERVQCPADPVAVEGVRGCPERLADRPGPGSVGHVHQRAG